MKNIYDNGTILLGVKKDIINYMDKIEFDIEDKKEILDAIDILENNAIVAINYDCGMGLSIDFWEKKDKIEK